MFYVGIYWTKTSRTLQIVRWSHINLFCVTFALKQKNSMIKTVILCTATCSLEWNNYLDWKILNGISFFKEFWVKLHQTSVNVMLILCSNTWTQNWCAMTFIVTQWKCVLKSKLQVFFKCIRGKCSSVSSANLQDYS